MDDFKKATVVDYTAFDLNCRHIVPHTKQRNKAEKIIKRKARRKLKKSLTKSNRRVIIRYQMKEEEKMKNYLFECVAESEWKGMQLIISANTLAEAECIASIELEKVKFICELAE